jgi:hypothetical protein
LVAAQEEGEMTRDKLLEGVELARQAMVLARACKKRGIYGVTHYQVQADEDYLPLADGDVETDIVGDSVHYRFEIQGIPFVVITDVKKWEVQS